MALSISSANFPPPRDDIPDPPAPAPELEVFVAELYGNGIGSFNRGVFNDWSWNVLKTSADCAVDDTDTGVVLATAGIYRITIFGRVEGGGNPDNPDYTGWPSGPAVFGSSIYEEVNSNSSGYARSSEVGTTALNLTEPACAFTDVHLFSCPADAYLVPICLYASAYAIESGREASFSAKVEVQRLGDLPA